MSDGAQPPDDSDAVERQRTPRAAGGLGAIAATARHVAGAGWVRGLRALGAVNQPDGFDCPGCAWPEPEDRATFEFCENGAKAVASEATGRRADAAFFAAHPISDLAARPDHWLNAQGRLTEPLVLREGDDRYRPISWDEAFALAGRELAALDSPDAAVLYTSGRTSNEAAFLYQLFARRFGTNNLPDCSDMCHESSGVALRESLGVGKGTVQLEDFAAADAIFVVGQNPGTNHPRMMTTLQAAARRGCRIVSVNPLPEVALSRFAHPQQPLDLLGRGTPIACLHLPVRIGGDAALFRGVAKELLEEERRHLGRVLDRRFITEHTEGFEEFVAAVASTPWTAILEGCGLTRAQVRAAAEVALGAERIIACWAMGLTQHRDAVATIREVVNFLLLRGNVGRPGAGACPVRGHSNVQGARTMGIAERVDDDFLDRLGARYGFAPPRAPSLDTVAAIEAMRDGRAQVFVALGGNFLSATPDTEATAAALRRCRLTVQISTKLNRSHLVTGRQALILPALSRTEVDAGPEGPRLVTVEDSMSCVHASRGALPPIAEGVRSEPAIVAGLAAAVLDDGGGVPWQALVGDYDRLRDEIAAVIPGFEEMNRRVRAGGFTLPNPARERRFPTPGGRARFSSAPPPAVGLAPGELVLMTIRSHDQFNTTVYGPDDRYRGVRGGRRVLFMNPDDLRARGLRDGQIVDLTSHFAGETRTARRFALVPYPIPPGCAATYFPEANALVPLGSVADGSRTPTSKSIVVTVSPTS